MEKKLEEKDIKEKIEIEKCLYCKGDLYGKKEIKNNITYYGFYCKKCRRWIVKDIFVLDNRFMYMDKEIYSIILKNKDEIDKIKKVLEKNTNIEKIEPSLNKNKEIIMFKGNAKEVFHFMLMFNSSDKLFKIEPEFPYLIIQEQITLEELMKLM